MTFYSIPQQCWCHFDYVQAAYGYPFSWWVDIVAPKKKEIKLKAQDDTFKVGKVSCRRYYKRRAKDFVMVIDDIEYQLPVGIEQTIH